MRVFVRRLEFYAYHGVPAEERQIGHRYVADLDVEIHDRAGETDMVEDTVDYGALAKRLEVLAAGSQHQTLESLVTHCGRQLMEEFPRIRSMKLSIAKRLPPAPIHAEEAGVEQTFTRPPTV